jgi:hypothetical protein
MRRILVAVAVIAIVLGALVGIRRRIRRFDDLAAFHRSQIVDVVWLKSGPDGAAVFSPSGVSQNGSPIPPRQQRLDRWHVQMMQEYLRAARYPWLDVVEDSPPRE